MREVVLDPRPKWRRRLGAHSWHTQILILAKATGSFIRDLYLCGPNADSWFLHVEDWA